MIGRVAAKLGKPYMPWQQHVIDVATEIDPATGHLWYREVLLTIPRQSGKTTLTLPRVVWRAEAAHLLGGRQRMLYAAQTGIAAKQKWQEDFVEDLDVAPIMRGRYRTILATGRERVRFKSGSTFAPIATKATSGHGQTLDDGTLDEAFAQVDNRVEESWRPAMITRRDAQLWIVSTAGDRRSTYLRSKVNRGRAIVEGGRASRTAVFEWSAPHDADPESPETWAACMPALGFTQTIEAVRHEFETIEGGLPAFRRAYLNQWSDEFDDAEWVLPKVAWGRCLDEGSRRAGAPALAVDTTPDRSRSSVAFAAPNGDGMPMVQVVRHGDGTDWVVAHVAQLVREKGATCVVLDGISPASNLRADLEAELGGRAPLWVTTAGEMADACASIYDAVITEQLRHVGQAELDTSVAGAAERMMSGGRKAWDRKDSLSDISPLVAVTLALAGLAKFPGEGSILY